MSLVPAAPEAPVGSGTARCSSIIVTGARDSTEAPNGERVAIARDQGRPMVPGEMCFQAGSIPRSRLRVAGSWAQPWQIEPV
jgi:hypothetical protein